VSNPNRKSTQRPGSQDNDEGSLTKAEYEAQQAQKSKQQVIFHKSRQRDNE